MSLREKHLSDQNRMAKMMSVVIVASMLLISLLTFFEQVRVNIIVRCIVLAAVIIVNLASCRVFRTSEVYRHIVSVSTFIAYLAFIFTYRETFVFAYIFPIDHDLSGSEGDQAQCGSGSFGGSDLFYQLPVPFPGTYE